MIRRYAGMRSSALAWWATMWISSVVFLTVMSCRVVSSQLEALPKDTKGSTHGCADLEARSGSNRVRDAVESNLELQGGGSSAPSRRRNPETRERADLQSADRAHVDVHRDIHLPLAVHAGDDRSDLRKGVARSASLAEGTDSR